MAIKRVKIEADLETTTTPDDVRAWAVCAVDIDTAETVYLSNSLDDFFEWLSDKNTTCWFHNLRFDGEYLLHWLLTHGFKHEQKDNATREGGTFQTLITDEGVFYSIRVIFEKLNKKYKQVTFYDSLKKLPFKVSVIAKAFELEDSKGEIDYNKYRPVGYELDDNEKDYIIKDCRIVSQALKIQIEKGLDKMTNASDAMNWYKQSIGKAQFERWFPVLPIELDADIRQAYKGGFTYLNPKHKNRRGLAGITLDVNSLYPSRMYYELLPYGYPMFFEGEYVQDDNYPLYIIRLQCAFELKKGHIPTIQLKKNRAFVETEYLSSSRNKDTGKLEIVEMTLTSVDLALFRDHYNIYCETYICGWKFKGAKGMFKDYIDYWMQIKETTTGAMRQLAKLQLNSLYGRFALNPKTRQKLPMIDHEGVVRYTLSEIEWRDPVYTAMGCFITAYARNVTIRSAQSVYDRFIYADTDSLHLIGEELPEGLEIHPTALGKWCHEATFTDSKFIRQKTYMETIDGIDHVTCAGMPDNVKELVTYENFHQGSTFDGKLMPRRFKGGIVLIPTTFTIK